MSPLLAYLFYWRHSRGNEKVNRISRPKAVTSISTFLGHYIQLSSVPYPKNALLYVLRTCSLPCCTLSMEAGVVCMVGLAVVSPMPPLNSTPCICICTCTLSCSGQSPPPPSHNPLWIPVVCLAVLCLMGAGVVCMVGLAAAGSVSLSSDSR